MKKGIKQGDRVFYYSCPIWMKYKKHQSQTNTQSQCGIMKVKILAQALLYTDHVVLKQDSRDKLKEALVEQKEELASKGLEQNIKKN